MKKEIVVALVLLIAFSPIANAKIIYLTCASKFIETPNKKMIGEHTARKFIVDFDNKKMETGLLDSSMYLVDRVNIGISYVEGFNDESYGFVISHRIEIKDLKYEMNVMDNGNIITIAKGGCYENDPEDNNLF